MEKINVILVVLLVIAILGVGYMWGVNKANKKQVQAIERVYQEKIDNLQNQLIEKDKELLDLETEIAEFEEDLQILRDDLINIRKDNEKMKEKLKEAPPEALVSEARRIVDTEEIWQSGEDIKFSLSAFRDNTIILAEWENFKIRFIPNLQETISVQKDTISALNAKDLIWKEKEKLWESQRESLERINDEWKEFVIKRQRRGFFDTVLKIGGGVLAGIVVGKVVLK